MSDFQIAVLTQKIVPHSWVCITRSTSYSILMSFEGPFFTPSSSSSSRWVVSLCGSRSTWSNSVDCDYDEQVIRGVVVKGVLWLTVWLGGWLASWECGCVRYKIQSQEYKYHKAHNTKMSNNFSCLPGVDPLLDCNPKKGVKPCSFCFFPFLPSHELLFINF